MKATAIVVHCSDSAFGCTSLIDSWHRARGFASVGYHEVIMNGYPFSTRDFQQSLDGSVEMGRPPYRKGAHVRHHNGYTIGICLIGIDKFSAYQYFRLRRRVQWHESMLRIDRIVGHYELDNKKTCPNIDMASLRKYLSEPSESESYKLLLKLPMTGVNYE